MPRCLSDCSSVGQVGSVPSRMELFLLLLPMVALPSTMAFAVDERGCSGLMERKPEFIAAPRVKRTGLNSVRVSWDGLVSNKDCAKQFKVMWWVEGTSPTTDQR